MDELERAGELTEPLGVQWVVVTPELSAQEVREFQTEDPDLGPLFDWLTAEQTPSADNLRQHSLETRNLGAVSCRSFVRWYASTQAV